MDEKQIISNLQKKQLIILKEIVRLCDANNIRYYLGYGTCLGAIRHKGFIPWDDDIDVLMPYPDMMEFENICANHLNTEMFFYQTPRTDSEYGLSFCRMRMNSSKLIEKNSVGTGSHTGIFVDIYPIYGAAKSLYGKCLQILHAMIYCLFHYNNSVKNHGRFMMLGSEMLLKMFSNKNKKKIAVKYFEKMSKYNYETSDEVVSLHSQIAEMRRVFPAKIFGNGKRIEFEDMHVMVPFDYDQYLTICYGDYMRLPPLEKQCMHHEYVFVDFNKGNENFIKHRKGK